MKFVNETPKKKDTEPRDPSRRRFLRTLGGAAVGAAVGVTGLDKTVKAFNQEFGKELTNEEIRVKWEEYKKLLGEYPNLKKDMDFLEDIRGKNTVSIVRFGRRILEDMDSMIQEEKRMKSQGRRFEDLLVTEPYRTIFRNIGLLLDKKKFEQVGKQSFEINKREAEVAGFEKLPGINNAELKKLLEKDFDPRWLYGNLSSITYIDQADSEGIARIFGGGTYALSAGSLPPGRDLVYKEGIKFYKGTPASLSDIVSVVSHELGHVHNWTSTNVLNIAELVQFEAEVNRHFESSDRIKFSYVEDLEKEIQPKGRQVNEYWSEIMKSLYLSPEELKIKSPKAYELALKWRNLILSRYGPK